MKWNISYTHHMYTFYYLIYICFNSFIRIDQYRLKKHERSNVTNKSLRKFEHVYREKITRVNKYRVFDDLIIFIFVTTDVWRKIKREK